MTITIPKLRNCNQNLIQLSEIEFYDSNGNQLTSGTVTNPGGDSPPGEGADKVFDQNKNTKWLSRNAASGGRCSISTLVFTELSRKPKSMIVVTANDDDSRDPVSFEVKVCTGEDTDCTFVAFRDVAAPFARLTNYAKVSLEAQGKIIII